MVAAAGKFADGTPFLELHEHFQQGSVVGFLEIQAATDIIDGDGIGPNLQKTKDIIGTQVRGASHKLGPEGGCRRARRILLTFFWGTRNFFRRKGLHTQANTRPAARPPSGQSDIPRKGNLGGGTTWPASPFYFNEELR